MDLLEQRNNRRWLAYPLCLWYSAGNTLWCQIGAMISLWIFFWEKKCRRALVDVLDLVVSVLLELGILFTKIIIVQRIMIRTFNKYLAFSSIDMELIFWFHPNWFDLYYCFYLLLDNSKLSLVNFGGL